ncbi:MAG: hypothetical protein WB709_12605 [Solirubrobacteraceae bacterium]
MSDFQTELQIDEPRVRIGLITTRVALDSPGTSCSPVTSGQERMLAAIERVFPVRFEGDERTSLAQVDGMLVLGSGPLVQTARDIPRLVLPHNPRQDGAQIQGDRATAYGEETAVALADELDLARPLRGVVIPESALPVELPVDPAPARMLASSEGRIVWAQQGDAAETLHTSAYPLAELRQGEALREHLRAGRFMGLLPLVHFLERLLGAEGWKPPPLRAAFVVDDPNLHWTSYGFIKYGELAAHAAQHGYHIGLATVPLDGWLFQRRAAALFAKNTSVLSLLVHGNDHVARELGRLDTDRQAESAIAQALRRIAALERRTGVRIDRVMAPPHESCSEAALRAMFRLGMEAACISQPHPWRDGLPAATPLAGWYPAELVAGGLPVLPRYPLSAGREDLALRALLGQPLILYGHHGDFAHGLDVLAQAACEVNSLGDVEWGSLSWIARGSYATRHVEGVLHLRMDSRRIVVDVAPGTHALRVFVREPFGGGAGHRLMHAGGVADIAFERGIGTSELLRINTPGRIELALMADMPLSPVEIRSPGIRPWPWLRRALVEGRDRIQPLR